MLTADRDAGGMYLRIAWVGEKSALLVSPPSRSDIATLGVSRKKKHVAVPTCGQHDRIAGMRRDIARHQISHDDTFGMLIDYHYVQHFGAREHLHGPEANLAAKRLVSAQQELLPGLATRIKSAGNLGPSEGPIGQ